jgi:hypothetical protein
MDERQRARIEVARAQEDTGSENRAADKAHRGRDEAEGLQSRGVARFPRVSSTISYSAAALHTSMLRREITPLLARAYCAM